MDIKTFCEYTYNFTHIPIYIYKNQHLSEQIHSHLLDITPPKMIEKQIMHNTDPISIYETSIGSYYGKIHLYSQDISVILGPITPLKYNENNLHKFYYEYGIPTAEQKTYQSFLLLIPVSSLISFISLLYQMSYALTNVKSDLPQEQLAPYRLEGMPSTAELIRHTGKNLEEGYHNTLYETQKLTMPMIQNGDLEGLYRYGKNLLPMNYGVFSKNLREQQLVVFIISVSSAMTAAIQGGLDPQTALSMAELYIRHGLKLNSPTDIDTLSMNAIIEFTKHVREEKQDTSSSLHPSIYNCIQYIRERVYTPVTVAEIADYAGYSPEHFSRIFKKESGFNAGEFIMNSKLYESKKLLKFTNMTIGEISSQLYFSNQSHFQKSFKKKFHMTPLQFRNSDGQI